MRQISENKRQRAPSQRSLETRARIFDAAELAFAARGFEGATIRDIAAAARVQKALVSFHGGSKEGLFAKVVERRAQELADIRLAGLDALLAGGSVSLWDILDSFIRPLLEKSFEGGSQWRAYARLVAHVSSDQRWHDISQTCFDPTAKRFIAAITCLYPNATQQAVAACFVFAVSSTLALCTSMWRVSALGAPVDDLNKDALVNDLIAFCEAGMRGVLTQPVSAS